MTNKNEDTHNMPKQENNQGNSIEVNISNSMEEKEKNEKDKKNENEPYNSQSTE